MITRFEWNAVRPMNQKAYSEDLMSLDFNEFHFPGTPQVRSINGSATIRLERGPPIIKKLALSAEAKGALLDRVRDLFCSVSPQLQLDVGRYTMTQELSFTVSINMARNLAAYPHDVHPLQLEFEFAPHTLYHIYPVGRGFPAEDPVVVDARPCLSDIPAFHFDDAKPKLSLPGFRTLQEKFYPTFSEVKKWRPEAYLACRDLITGFNVQPYSMYILPAPPVHANRKSKVAFVISLTLMRQSLSHMLAVMAPLWVIAMCVPMAWLMDNRTFNDAGGFLAILLLTVVVHRSTADNSKLMLAREAFTRADATFMLALVLILAQMPLIYLLPRADPARAVAVQEGGILLYVAWELWCARRSSAHAPARRDPQRFCLDACAPSPDVGPREYCRLAGLVLGFSPLRRLALPARGRGRGRARGHIDLFSRIDVKTYFSYAIKHRAYLFEGTRVGGGKATVTDLFRLKLSMAPGDAPAAAAEREESEAVMEALPAALASELGMHAMITKELGDRQNFKVVYAGEDVALEVICVRAPFDHAAYKVRKYRERFREVPVLQALRLLLVSLLIEAWGLRPRRMARDIRTFGLFLQSRRRP
mmetsp:Transcript_37134/g.116857  ORF Transcript_37134/g.116857 Transcript_37134/m.116857 type:complete len:589 (-) Transcript_37134:196-1962(-)